MSILLFARIAVWRRLFYTRNRRKKGATVTVNQIKRIFGQAAKDQEIDIMELWLHSRHYSHGLTEVNVEEMRQLLKDWCGV
ncbi:unnamed protein product [Protopolystoma xenopodis]|uniref:Uncharacterized protein n=1 Tax=Protopolystoma xenopodis TaxID=117903 RepID=A0A448WQH8_9PLAT|nr:unnamed protein product [Protopolystoma xenopodis]